MQISDSPDGPGTGQGAGCTEEQDKKLRVASQRKVRLHCHRPRATAAAHWMCYEEIRINLTLREFKLVKLIQEPEVLSDVLFLL